MTFYEFVYELLCRKLNYIILAKTPKYDRLSCDTIREDQRPMILFLIFPKEELSMLAYKYTHYLK